MAASVVGPRESGKASHRGHRGHREVWWTWRLQWWDHANREKHRTEVTKVTERFGGHGGLQWWEHANREKHRTEATEGGIGVSALAEPPNADPPTRFPLGVAQMLNPANRRPSGQVSKTSKFSIRQLPFS